MERKTLVDGNVRLVPYEPEYAERLFEAVTESVAEAGPYLPFCHEGYTIEEAREWTTAAPEKWEKGTEYNFLIEDARTGKFVGGGGLSLIDVLHGKANLGYWVRTSRAGEGFATAAAKMLARWGVVELALQRLEIHTAMSNAGSHRVALKAGAVKEGIMRNRFRIRGKPEDGVLYSITPAEVGGD